MKKATKRIISLLLCMCLCANCAISAYAANENNTKGVTFNAELDKSSIMVSDVDQTVTMKVNASEGVLLEGIGATVVWDKTLELTEISNEDSRIDFSGSTNIDNGKIAWAGTDNLDQLENVTNIAVVTFNVPANTPAGTYTVGIEDIELTENYGDIWESTASATATLTITEPVIVDGYTAGINTLTQEVSVDDTITINVGVSHSEDTTFAAAEVILTYDTTLMTFNQDASTLGSATVKDNNGTLILEDYGADKNFGNGVYVLVFDAIADGETSVSIESAAFVNKTNAVQSDLIAATLSAETITLTINKKTHTVVLPEIFEGLEEVIDGEDYTFTVADGNNYVYDSVTATMNGVAVDVIDNGNGTYTIENVTGELVITGSRTEKTYAVRFEGNAAEEITDGAETATYNTDYTFTMPTAEGWAYSMDGMTINGETYTGYTVENSVYTIPGSAITGEIVITVNKTDTEATVRVEGSGAGIADGYEPTVEMNTDYTLTTVPEAGYTYTVTATMGGNTAAVINNGDNTYTIKNVTGDIIFTIERHVVVDGVSVVEYLTLDGTVMWLVKNEVTLADNKVPTYDGEKMFMSEKYNAYCYLVVAETLSVEEAVTKVDITDGTADSITYDMDVNITGKVDASDAQLTYNMYNAMYSNITEQVTMEKFLRSDVNGDGKVNVEDATAIIAYLLA